MLKLIDRGKRIEWAIALGRRLSRVRIRGIPRLMYMSGGFVLGPGIQTVQSVSGLQIAIDARDYASCMMFFGRFSAELISLMNSLVKVGDSVLDVGAQLGYVSSHLARLVGPSGVVHSFEPDPNALLRLRATVQANGHSWVLIFPIALGNDEGELSFNVSPVLGWSTAVSGSHLVNLSQITVPVTTVDRLASAGRIRRPVTFVKIDVEGYECAVLDGMSELLERDRPFILTEVNPVLLKPAALTPADLLSKIEKHRYRLFRVQERSGVLSGGEIELSPVTSEQVTEFCDVLGVPEEKQPFLRRI